MKEEYDAIYKAGIVLQLDCPDLPGAAGDEDVAIDEFRKLVAMRLEAVDHTTRAISHQTGCASTCAGATVRDHTIPMSL